MEYTTVNGLLFREMLIAAAAMVENNKGGLNELNVFPVPDGDTGTNMAMTIRAAADALSSEAPAESLSDTAGKISSALLRGARGNSGVIMSLLFRGMSKRFKGLDSCDLTVFAEGMKAGVEAAYGAVMKPAEGTVLTVSRKAAEKAQEIASQTGDILSLLKEARVAADEALALTPTQNPVLAKAGVVDAGGQGYVYILDGFISALEGKTVSYNGSSTAAPSAFEAFDTEDITFAYCTEFLIIRDGNTKSALNLRAYLETIGDCVVVVDDDELIKVHVHSNNPGKVLEEALTYGYLSKIKIENMKEQHTEKLVHTEEAPAAPAEAVPEEKEEPFEEYGFVAVSCGEGLDALFRELGVNQLVSGGQTMNPSTADILAAIEKVNARNVFVLPNNKNIELAARQTVGLSPKHNILVVPSHTIPEGICSLLAFEPNIGGNENLETMENAIRAVQTGSITYAARDAFFDDTEIKEGDIMALVGGKVRAVSKSISEAVNAMLDITGCGASGIITIYYGADVTEAEGETIQSLVQARFPDAEVSLISGGQPIYYYLFSME